MNILELNEKNAPLIYWRNDDQLSKLINVFVEDYDIRFVGGCVRDSMLDKKLKDIDFAINCMPEETIKILVKNNIEYLDYGIDFGTVTALMGEQKYEITSLRKDVDTNGRFPEVEFTDSWEEDAFRRDFTINSIYVSMNGEIFDLNNGVEDLKKNKLRFIGDAEKRIKEDFLRIMRFYRFLGLFAEPKYEIEQFQLIEKYFLEMHDNVSKNKIKKELIKMSYVEFPQNSFLLTSEKGDSNKKNLFNNLENYWKKINYIDGMNIIKKYKLKYIERM